MPDVLQNIGNFLGSSGGQAVEKAGIGGAGFLQNWLANREAKKKQDYVMSLLTDPKKFQALVTQAEQPLSKGLTTDIARQTDAYGAERGLGSTPAIMKDVYAQALAPYQQREQQMAIDSVLKRLGIYADTPTTKGVDLTSIFKMLQMGDGGAKPPDVTAGIDLNSVPNPGLTAGELGLPGPMIDTGSTLPPGGDF